MDKASLEVFLRKSASGVSKPQAFKNVFLQMVIDQTSTFRRKNSTTFKF